MISSSSARLDAFTDAAFAFAVTLLVVGSTGIVPDYKGLLLAMKSVPSFAIGFAIIGMFWHAHVRWRGVRGEGNSASVLLTFLLIFAVLVYIQPLRAMSTSFASFIGGGNASFGGPLAAMFAIYGIGFTLMSAVTCALFHNALGNSSLDAEAKHIVKGERAIWAILMGTGMISTFMTQIGALSSLAPFVYATLPVTIPMFVARWFRRKS